MTRDRRFRKETKMHPPRRPAPPDSADTRPLRTVIADVMREARVPGLSIAVTGHDRILFADGFGWADLASRRPATPETRYLWFSMSKIATATAAMALAEQQRLDLDAPIDEFVRGYPSTRVTVRPTVRRLLNHTSGIANPLPLRWVRPADAAAPDPQAFLARVLRHHGKPKYPIGAAARYSNLGYLVLAEIIATVAGRPFEAVMREVVLDPAAMSETGYRRRAGAPHATGYVRLPRPFVPALRAVLPRGLVGNRHGAYQAFRPFLVNGAGYGGLVGDVLDAARLAALHLGDGIIDGHRVLSPESTRLMRTVTTPGKPFDLGLGWFRKPKDALDRPAHVEHLGSGGGYYNAMRIYPEVDLGVVLMANTTRPYDHHRICTACVTTFARAEQGTPPVR